MQNVTLPPYADTGSYKLWIQVGIAALAAGFIIAGLGSWFARDTMIILGNFLRQPGGVLLATGVAMAGLKGDDLSDGVRVGAVVAAGLMALGTL